ncbi:hypothetical protein HPB51_000584 [Rhipicephalus microplus]|uniref:Uncharacterized protein n=1 Tax=Rhipicephalus microplus TaxID=6941 RepID=A0A9J6DKD9_RHIMP|nr:hypothetical protein HPB51_000584 [Rhipicephalus microplus]
MVWTSVASSDSRQELPESSKSTTLAAAVTRRKRMASYPLTVASTDSGIPGSSCQRGRKCLLPDTFVACDALRGPTAGPPKALWWLQLLPKPKALDFVVVLRPRTQLFIVDTFSENEAGRALLALFGATATWLITVVMGTAIQATPSFIGSSSRPLEEKRSPPTEIGFSVVAAGDSARCRQPCPAPTPWLGGSGGSTLTHNYGRTTSQQVYSEAALARPSQTETVVAWTQTRRPGRSTVGRPRPTRISGLENADLDRCFHLHDLKAALPKMKRGTVTGRDPSDD